MSVVILFFVFVSTLNWLHSKPHRAVKVINKHANFQTITTPTLFAKMDLMCNEKEMFKDHHHVDNHMQQMLHIEPQVNTASADPTFLSERCLENLLKSEETHPSLINFYNNPQCEITPKMRRIVAEWMMEVSFPYFFFIYFGFARQSIWITQVSLVVFILFFFNCNWNCANYAIVSNLFDLIQYLLEWYSASTSIFGICQIDRFFFFCMLLLIQSHVLIFKRRDRDSHEVKTIIKTQTHISQLSVFTMLPSSSIIHLCVCIEWIPRTLWSENSRSFIGIGSFSGVN